MPECDAFLAWWASVSCFSASSCLPLTWASKDWHRWGLSLKILQSTKVAKKKQMKFVAHVQFFKLLVSATDRRCLFLNMWQSEKCNNTWHTLKCNACRWNSEKLRQLSQCLKPTQRLQAHAESSPRTRRKLLWLFPGFKFVSKNRTTKDNSGSLAKDSQWCWKAQ